MTPTQPTHTTTEVSEAMVELAYDAYIAAMEEHWSRGGEIDPNVVRRASIKAALSAALSPGDGVPGMVLVPREPTPEMLRAAIDAIPMDKYIDIGARRSNVTLSTDECATIYQTMLAAASSTGRETP